ncbi:RIP metalloprotease RseP [Tsuneonella mangrovi]|uniref:RIP metalloprotease RseP n=1 Tax=Tsuneonella mangrovi TaxID=1982042 RepID=UPI000BA23177|nr:RIP metalloprotease RseP [Tsuneonella mangrovi]
MTADPPFWLYIVGFALLLGPLVTVHELGHYLVGRLFKVRATAFSIGFGREIFGRTDKLGTRWKLSLLPLGGYVQFKGDMNPASIPDHDTLAKMTPEERDGAFQFTPLWQRALIVAAGPFTNLVVAIAIFAGFFMAYGQPVQGGPDQTNVVVAFPADSPAKAAGVAKGDKIVSVDGRTVANFSALRNYVIMHPDENIVLGIERDGDRIRVPVTTGSFEQKDEFGNTAKLGLLGIESSPYVMKPVGPLQSIGLAWGECTNMVRMMVTGIGQIFVGQRSVEELGGPIKMAKWSGEQLSLGPQAFVAFVAFVSLNLAFINILPIPALDGGHLAFYAAEAIRRKPVNPRGQEMAFRAGVAVVLALMLFVTVNDLLTLPIFGR